MKLTIAHLNKTKFRINHLKNVSPEEETIDILLSYLRHENEKRYKETWGLEDLMLALHIRKEVTDILQ